VLENEPVHEIDQLVLVRDYDPPEALGHLLPEGLRKP